MKKLLAITIALMLAAISVLPVFAENIQSPSVAPMPPVIKVIDDPEKGHVVIDRDKEVDPDGKQKVTITGVPEDGYEFEGWDIEGDYEPIGKLTDRVLELIAKGDLTVKPRFVKKGESGTEPAGSSEKVIDDSSKSPQTGSSATPYVVLFTSVAALFAVVAIAKRRSAK